MADQEKQGASVNNARGDTMASNEAGANSQVAAALSWPVQGQQMFVAQTIADGQFYKSLEREVAAALSWPVGINGWLPKQAVPVPAPAPSPRHCCAICKTGAPPPTARICRACEDGAVATATATANGLPKPPPQPLASFHVPGGVPVIRPALGATAGSSYGWEDPCT